MITVQHLTKSYEGLVAVSNVSFTVEEEQTLVLLGTSGSGKTTTLRMLNRLVEPTSGTIAIDGKDIFTLPPHLLRRSIGYVLQGYGLFPHYTVAENIAVVPTLLNWSKERIDQRVNALMEKLHLSPAQYRNVYPAQLSGGQMQRVGLARALAADPPILLMDEPFGALDPLTRRAVQKEFQALDELKKKTVVLVTHDVQEAFALGNKIGLMDNGQLQQLGAPSDLLFSPASVFVSNFFQHQHLLLAWQTITLKDIWQALPAPGGATPVALKSSQTIWEAMERLMQQNEAIAAYDEETASAKALTLSHLQTALQQKSV